MKEKNLSIATLVMTILMLVLGILEKKVFDTSVFYVILPLLFIAACVCGYYGFKDKTAFTSKWTFVFLAMFFTFALSGVANIFVSGLSRFLVTAILYAVGVIGVFVSVLDKRLFKIMPIAFAVLAFETLISGIFGAFTVMTFLMIVTYLVFALMALRRFPEYNKFLRLAGGVLVLICFGMLGFYMAAALIILAFLLVPGGKLIEFSGAKLVALLCIITAIANPIVTFMNEPFAKVEYASEEISMLIDELNSLKTVEEYEKDIEDYNAKAIELNSKTDELEKSLETANTELDVLCYRSYYSSWLCTPECKVFHDKIDKIEDEIDVIEEEIVKNEENIAEAETNKARVIEITEELLPDAYSEFFEAVTLALILMIAMILSVIALVCLAICLFRGCYNNLAVWSCIIMTVSSLIYMVLTTTSLAYWSFDLLNYPIFKFLASPYLWSIVIFTMFSLIFAKKSSKVIKFRVFAIIAAIIMSVLSFSVIAEGAQVMFILYAITMIGVSFVLVPLVFTEYNNIAKHIFFTLITCGIWQIIWIYNVTKNLNKVSGVENRKPVKECLLCIFLPLYIVYWMWKTAEAVEAYGVENGKQFKITILCLAFMFVNPIIPTILIQEKINNIVGKPE